MQLVPFVLPGVGRRVGVIHDGEVIDLTSAAPACRSVYPISPRPSSACVRLGQPLLLEHKDEFFLAKFIRTRSPVSHDR